MRVAVVIQRYGVEVNGGAEFLCRQTCEHLVQNPRVDSLTVLTTCARDHTTWANHYEPGATEIEGVRVERFVSSFERVQKLQSLLNTFVLGTRFFPGLELPWFVAQGPFSPGLLRRLIESRRRNEFDVYLFYTYLYAPTVLGLPLVADRAVLTPTAHDETPIHMNAFRLLFRLPRGFAFLTPEERDFVMRKFHRQGVPSEVVGTGIDLPQTPAAPCERAPSRPYVLYVGRIEPHKGFPDLFEHFDAFKSRHADTEFIDGHGHRYLGRDLVLALAGRVSWVEVPTRDDIIELGFVSDDEKRSLVAGCEVFVLPSHYESLSLVILEAWAEKRPVMVHGACEATSGQVRRSSGGARYESADEFSEHLAAMLRSPEARERAGSSGYAYVRDNYAWPAYEKRLLDLIERALPGAHE